MVFSSRMAQDSCTEPFKRLGNVVSDRKSNTPSVCVSVYQSL